jgi:hypothetical protein
MIKKVKLKLVGIDGNAFSIMGAFRSAAIKQGWTQDEISALLEKAMEGDYYHLLKTIQENCK